MKNLSMRTLRRLYHNKKMWEERKFKKATSLKDFVKVNKSKLAEGVENMSPKAEKLLL